MQTRDDIFATLKNILVNEFEIEESQVVGSATLYEELDLDSIDAVDLVVRLREITGKKIEPEAFRQVRTVDDIINEVQQLIVA